MTFTLRATTPELSSLNTLTQLDSNGVYTSNAWKIVAKDVSGNTKTFAATGNLRDFFTRKGEQNKVLIDCFVRITGNDVTIT